MRTLRSRRLALLGLVLPPLSVVACSKDDTPKATAPATAPSTAPPGSTPVAGAGKASASAGTTVVVGTPYLLAADPTGGLSILEAKAAAPRAGVVVVGRVKELTPGYAAFTLTDLSLQYCGQSEAEGCPTPWDYCCTPNEELAAGTIGVVVEGPGAEPVKLARIPDFRNADVVVVTGDLVKDADGNQRLLAKGWFRRERPKLPDSIVFPE